MILPDYKIVKKGLDNYKTRVTE